MHSCRPLWRRRAEMGTRRFTYLLLLDWMISRTMRLIVLHFWQNLPEPHKFLRFLKGPFVALDTMPPSLFAKLLVLSVDYTDSTKVKISETHQLQRCCEGSLLNPSS